MTRKEIADSIGRFASQMPKFNQIKESLKDESYANAFFEKVQQNNITTEPELALFLLSI